MRTLINKNHLNGQYELNLEVARILYDLAEMMDLKGDTFKRNAYQKAAKNIESLETDVRDVYLQGKLEEVPGVGSSIAGKIAEIIETGKLTKLEELKKELPPGAIEIMKVPNVGPKKAIRLAKELNVKDIKELKQAGVEHRIRI